MGAKFSKKNFENFLNLRRRIGTGQPGDEQRLDQRDQIVDQSEQCQHKVGMLLGNLTGKMIAFVRLEKEIRGQKIFL